MRALPFSSSVFLSFHFLSITTIFFQNLQYCTPVLFTFPAVDFATVRQLVRGLTPLSASLALYFFLYIRGVKPFSLEPMLGSHMF